MKLTCETQKLNKALQAATKILKSNAVAKIKAYNGTIEIQTNETPEYVSAKLPADIMEEGECIVKADVFYELVNRLDDKAIVLNTRKNPQNEDVEFQVIYNIEQKESATAKLNIINDAAMLEYPEINPEKTIEIKKDKFDQLLKKITIAVGKQDEKYNSIQMNFVDNTLNLNATDTHILANETLEFTNNNDNYDIVVPLDIVNQVLAVKSENNVKIDIQKQLIQFTVEEIKMTSQLLNFKFPNIERVIKCLGAENKIRLSVNRAETLKAIQRLNVFNKFNKEFQTLTLNIKDNNIFLKTSSAVGNITEHLANNNNETYSDITIGFNPTYLYNVCNSIEADNVIIRFAETNCKGVIFEDEKDKNIIYFISPQQVANAQKQAA